LELGYIPPPENIQVGDQLLKSIGVLGRGGEFNVFKCEYNNQEVAVKIPTVQTPNSLLFMTREVANINTLRQTDGLSEFIWKLMIKSQVLECLQKLHTAGYVHGDLRIDNLILFHDKIFLIDWQTMSVVGRPMALCHTSFLLTPSRILQDLGNMNHTEMMKADVYDDIEQLAYNLICLEADSIPWRVSYFENFSPTEYKKMESKRLEWIYNLSDLSIGKQILQCMKVV
jgi:predicted Ser/Thr protein kinase